MKDLLKTDSISQYNEWAGCETLNRDNNPIWFFVLDRCIFET
jgi:hypothetical protein